MGIAFSGEFSMAIALIIAIGLSAGLFSLWVSWRSRKAFENQILIATNRAATERLRRLSERVRDPDEHYVDGLGLVIGDITCQLNARSPFIRCAANPTGPCKGCRDYQELDY